MSGPEALASPAQAPAQITIVTPPYGLPLAVVAPTLAPAQRMSAGGGESSLKVLFESGSEEAKLSTGVQEYGKQAEQISTLQSAQCQP